MKNLRHHLLALAAVSTASSPAADLFWDGGTVNLPSNGNGVSTYASGTWSTSIANWDAGEVPRVAWNNSNVDTAIFGGTYATGTRNVTLGSDITVNQIQINTGSTGGNRYDILSDSGGLYSITFGGTYSTTFPAITGPGGTNGFLNNNFGARITGTIEGGLVIRHGSNITTPGSSGRFGLTNGNNSFTGDVVIAGGNVAFNGSNGVYGNSANKIVLAGGALFTSGAGAVSTTFVRNVEVASASGIATNAATSGLQVVDMTGNLTGSAELIRYSATAGTATSELRLSGDLSGYTGTFDCRGTAATLLTIQSTAPSGGTWKISGGTVKLNTAGDDQAIAHGPGKSDLLMNGGTLNLNGLAETINGLSGTSGSVLNGLADTTSTLTLGAGDATASYGGTFQNGSGTLAIVKTGTGTQTFAGNATHTGDTTVQAGTLALGGNYDTSPVTVKGTARLNITAPGKNLEALTLEGGATLSVPMDLSGIDYLGIDQELTFTGGTVTVAPTFAEPPQLGTYDLAIPQGGIIGSATLVADFSSNGPTRITGSVQATGGVLMATVTSLGGSLVWNNAAATSEWAVDSGENFLLGAGNARFLQYDAVTFGPSSPGGSITLIGHLLPSTVTVDSAADFTFTGSGAISGSTTLDKSGSGTLTIANSHSFTGATTVNGGTLALTGSLGSGGITVASAATLTGSGSVSGPLDVQGTLSPGSGTATLASGAAVISGTYVCDLDGALSDKLAVTGSLDLTGATLSLNPLSPPTAGPYEIATYTGTLTGTFDSIPAGWIVDTSVSGKILLWATPAAPPVGTITFDQAQDYPAAPAVVAGIGSTTGGNPYTGVNGWSLSNSTAPANVFAMPSSGFRYGTQAIGAGNANTYIGGQLHSIQRTGTATISFECQYFSGTAVGLFKDLDEDGLFDGSPEAGMTFGVGGSPARFNYRNAAFGTENFGPGFTGTAGHWYRFEITIGESTGGNRNIVMAVRNQTTGADYDFNPLTPESDPWSFSVTDAQFGTAPELSDGVMVRATASARIDNILATSAAVPTGTAYDAWIDGFPSLTGDDRLSTADPDRDGIENLMEFVLDGNPSLSDPSILPTAARSGDSLVFTFRRRDDAESLTTQTVQHGTNLATWTDIPIGATGGAGYTVTENGVAPDTITVTIPAAGEPRIFVRLLVDPVAP